MWLIAILLSVGMFFFTKGYRSNSLDGIIPMIIGMLLVIAAGFVGLGMML